MKNKIILLIICLISMLLIGSTSFGLDISTEAELRAFSADVRGGNNYEGQTVNLLNDITMSSTVFPTIGIGNTKQFFGTFDGHGHTISNLNINEAVDYVALFSFLHVGGVIKNLTVQGTVTGGGSRTAGIVAQCQGLVENCVNRCVVKGAAGGGHVGGITGRLYAGTITKCFNRAAVGYDQYNHHVGSIAGSMAGGGTITLCGNVSAVKGWRNVGGIVGFFDDGTIDNVYNRGGANGKVQTSEQGDYGLAGLIGKMSASTSLSNSYTTVATGNSSSGTGGCVVGLRISGASISNVHYFFKSSWGIPGAVCRGSSSGCVEHTVENDFKGSSLVGTLNGSQSPTVWSLDTSPNINGGFIILRWQKQAINEATAFISTWNIPASTTISLPIPSNASNAYVVNWGDGNIWDYTSEAFPTHTYTTAGTYTIKLGGVINSLGYYDWSVPTSNNAYSDYFTFCQYLTGVSQLGETSTTRYGFSNCANLDTFTAASSTNTFANVTSMSLMFYNCTDLTSISVSTWNTSTVTDMSYMFDGCSGLTSLPVNSWNTSAVTNMAGVFLGCSSLTSIPVGSWTTSSATNMSGLFQNCSALTSAPVSGWSTGSATNMSYMFHGCWSLPYIDLSNFNTTSVTNMDSMFNGCSGCGIIFLGDNFGKIIGSGMFSSLNNPCAIITTRSSVFTNIGSSLGVGSGTKLYVYSQDIETTFEGNSTLTSAFGGASNICPILEINPDNPMYMVKNATYTEPGYTVAGIASTNTSHPIYTVFGFSVDVVNYVNTSTPGTYQVIYSLSRAEV